MNDGVAHATLQVKTREHRACNEIGWKAGPNEAGLGNPGDPVEPYRVRCPSVSRLALAGGLLLGRAQVCARTAEDLVESALVADQDVIAHVAVNEVVAALA